MQPPKVRSLEEIIAETNKTFNPIRQTIEANRGVAQQQGRVARESIAARRDRSFRDVEQRAADKGVFFSGAPTARQQELDALEFNPAYASLEQRILDAERGIDRDLLDLQRAQQAEAVGIRASEQKTLADFMAEQQRLAQEQAQFEAEQAAAAARAAASRRSSSRSTGGSSYRSSGSSRSGGTSSGSSNFKMTQRGDGGFNFTNRSGQPISAAQYAMATGQDLISVLDSMGAAGDSYAGQVARQLRQDPFVQDNIDSYKQQYSSLFWGI